MEKQKEQKSTKHKVINLTGKRFAHLTAIEATDERDSRGCVIWRCACDCGKEVLVSVSKLRSGAIGSCGCCREDVVKRTYRCVNSTVDGNRIETLQKRKCRRDNKSGFRGVFQVRNGSYRVSIGFREKRYYLGYYSSLNEAIRIRLKAEELIQSGITESVENQEELISVLTSRLCGRSL